MRHIRFLAFGLVLSAVSVPALAQMGPGMGGTGMNSALGGGSTPQPRSTAPNIAPPALPGAGGVAPLATKPQMQKLTSGDPTTALFAAVNKGDYGAAQDAISRGADLNAQNQFGETPLDLSIALNRNTITFLLLQTRNELQAQNGGGPVGTPWAVNGSAPVAAAPAKGGYVKPAPLPAAVPHAVPVNATPGTPNAEAGFLGFGPKS